MNKIFGWLDFFLEHGIKYNQLFLMLLAFVLKYIYPTNKLQVQKPRTTLEHFADYQARYDQKTKAE